MIFVRKYWLEELIL